MSPSYYNSSHFSLTQIVSIVSVLVSAAQHNDYTSIENEALANFTMLMGTTNLHAGRSCYRSPAVSIAYKYK